MRYVCLLMLSLPILSAQDGAAIYKERCASCHDAPAERVPSLQTIKAMSPEAVYMTLTSGVMKSRAEGMPIAQLFALIGYIAPTGGTHTETLFHWRPRVRATPPSPSRCRNPHNGTAGAQA